MKDFFRKHIGGFRRWMSWRKVIWYNHDWDYTQIFILLAEKLRRMEKALNSGYHVLGTSNKAIRVARKLAERQGTFDYAARFHRKHDAKFGEVKMIFHYDGSVTTHRPKASSSDEEQAEAHEFSYGRHISQAREERERRWLFSIMDKHIIYWWD